MLADTLDDLVRTRWPKGPKVQLPDGSYLVPCPVPDHGKGLGDRHPSLHLSEGSGGRLLWHCKARCSRLAVQEGLRVSTAWRLGRGGSPLLSGGSGSVAGPSSRPPHPPAPAATRAGVYQALLDFLRLEAPDRWHLRARGLSDTEIDRNGYRSLWSPGWRDWSALRHSLTGQYGPEWEKVPGMLGEGGRFLPSRGPGFLVPYRGPDGGVLGLQARRPDGPTRYVWLGAGVRASETPHVPLACRLLPKREVRLVEGGLKADVVMCLSARCGADLLTTVGVAGLLWGAALPVLDAWGTRTVRLAFDQDGPGRQAEEEAREALAGEGFRVRVETWDGGRAKGLDDAALSGLAVCCE